MINFLLVFQDPALLLARVVLGLIMLVHGWPKLKNLDETASKFKDMGFKPGSFWASIVALLEVVGGGLLIVGLFTQAVAVLIAVQFLVILLTVKRNAPFKGEVELDLLILATSTLLATSGAGAWSLDSFLRLILY